jgi:iron complex transport system permease protein
LVLLGCLSVAVGSFQVSWSTLLEGGHGRHDALVLLASRVPRTLAAMLVGASMAVAGLLMQMLARNRFVAPSTAGTIESASLGLLVALLFLPNAPVPVKMLVAAAFALAGTALLLAVVRRVPLRSPVVVPLLGIMLGSVIGAATTFIAYRYDMLQPLAAWTTGDFSRVLRGRYEMLWIGAGLTAAAYVAADRFTVAGMGESFTKNLGIDYGRVVALGLTIVSLVTAVNVVTVGAVPFVGLVVPNLVNLAVGDNLRRAIPWVAVAGATLVLSCDLLGRVLRFPYEVPVGTS